MAKHPTTKRAELVGEITLYGNSAIGAGWLARGERTAILGSGEPVQGRTFTEAVWYAAGALEAAGVTAGVVAIFDAGGLRVALAPLGRIPPYLELAWHAVEPGLVLSAEAIAAAAE